MNALENHGNRKKSIRKDKKIMYGYKCIYCGANLDPGEKCDCGMRKYKKWGVKKDGKLISIQTAKSRD